MKTIAHKNPKQNQNHHHTPAPRPVRVLDADALSAVSGGFHFVQYVNKSSPG